MKKFKLYYKIYSKDILNELSYHKINNNIYLGNQFASNDYDFIKSNNISHIINVTKNIPNSFNNIIYLNIPIDTSNLNDNLNHLFDLSNKFFSNIIKNNQKVLIHCKYGHTRSALFLAIFLIYYYKYKPDYVINLIRNIRPNTLLRLNVIKKIYDYYNYLQLGPLCIQ
jgi:protein-tyrosine phosphatase